MIRNTWAFLNRQSGKLAKWQTISMPKVSVWADAESSSEPTPTAGPRPANLLLLRVAGRRAQFDQVNVPE
jgi:hypothetical protein